MSAMDRPSRVLVPLDGSAAAASAVPVARTLASLLGATLHFVHVAGEQLLPREAQERLGLPPETFRDAVVQAVTGRPAEAIVRLAGERAASVIVLCRRAGAAHAVAGLGVVAEEVLRAAPCPVVLVPGDRGVAEYEVRGILLPQDGTPAMAAALAPAAIFAERAGASLIVLHVLAPGGAPAREPGTLTTPRYVDQPHHEWPAFTREFLDRLGCTCPGLPVTRLQFLLGRGHPAEEILRHAAAPGVSLVALGWHGSLEPAHAATLKAVIERTPVPLLVVVSPAGQTPEAPAAPGCPPPPT